jgi:hypothetical protein
MAGSSGWRSEATGELGGIAATLGRRLRLGPLRHEAGTVKDGRGIGGGGDASPWTPEAALKATTAPMRLTLAATAEGGDFGHGETPTPSSSLSFWS